MLTRSIDAVGVEKWFRPGIVTPGRDGPRERHRVVGPLDLTVVPGETVGVLGPNGAGKTTLLRILAGVTRPSAGRVRTTGRVVPLISVGVGFHPELSGRENVELNGMLLGLTRAELRTGLEEIIDFSGLESSRLDSPVKFYSTGMQLRLAFSVSMQARPDILLLDEILAVGDLGFQMKCLDRMAGLKAAGTTIIFVSHSVHAIRLLCERGVLLEHGEKVFDGPTADAVREYHIRLTDSEPADTEALPVKITGRTLTDTAGATPTELERGKTYHLAYQLETVRPVDSLHLRFDVTSEDGHLVYSHHESLSEGSIFQPGLRVCEVTFVADMVGGTFRISVEFTDAAGDVVGRDHPGIALYRRAEIGGYGMSELGADIALGGVLLSDHTPLRLGAPE